MFKEKKHRPQISNLIPGYFQLVCLLDCQLVKGWVHTQKTQRFSRNHSGLNNFFGGKEGNCAAISIRPFRVFPLY